MSLISLIIGRHTPGKIGVFTLDATLNENHVMANQVTRFPVEDGSDISDHVISDPERVTITGFVTNTPVSLLGPVAALGNSRFVTNNPRTESMFSYLEQLFNNYGIVNPVSGSIPRELIEIVTGLKTYTEMIMVNANVPRNRQTGDSLHFTATFQKIRKVNSEKVIAVNLKEPAANGGQDTASLGNQNAAKATESQKSSSSVAYRLFLE